MYAIDKQEVSKEVFYDFYFNDSIPKQTFFLEGKSATDKYGEKGKYNVIEAYTKTGISNIVDQSVKPGIDLSYPGKQPLILINEQEATMEEVRALDPSFISSINVLKGFGAAAKYGDKGKNGVVEITLNKSKSQLVILGRSMTQEPEYAKIIKSPEVLRVYPNPSADKMKIDISISLTNVVEISLFDLNGKVIRKFMASYLDPGNYNLELNTEGIPSGNYILMANTGSTILKEQVIINN